MTSILLLLSDVRPNRLIIEQPRESVCVPRRTATYPPASPLQPALFSSVEALDTPIRVDTTADASSPSHRPTFPFCHSLWRLSLAPYSSVPAVSGLPACRAIGRSRLESTHLCSSRNRFVATPTHRLSESSEARFTGSRVVRHPHRSPIRKCPLG